jgi:protein-S-isoprenylcysteine O-methyltransferase Ste14
MSDLPPPAVNFPPPLLYLGMILFGWFLDYVLQLPEIPLSATLQQVLGALVVLLGIAINIPAVLKFKANDENVIPWTGSEKIIVSGIYRFTRNPMYLGMSLISLGIATWAGSYAMVGTALLASVIIDRFVIVREEYYLEKRFGQSYADYKSQVRRWL